MNLAVLAPVWRVLIEDERLEICFTHPDTADLGDALAGIPEHRRVVPRSRATAQRWDLYMNADPWGPAALWRCHRQINFFHGVAGKYDLECPTGRPLDLARYDCVAFPNAGRMHRYVDAGLVAPERAALVGFPKLDAIVNNRIPARTRAAALGLDGGRQTVIYAPTFSPQSSLHSHGEDIVRSLLVKNLNVIVKLHDRSLDPDPIYSGGQDWKARFAAFRTGGRFLFATDADSTDYLLASDVMITDHSTIGFEFCAQDRPLVVFDAPDLLVAARVDAGKSRLLRDAADVVTTIPELDGAIQRALLEPGIRRVQRRKAVEDVFYDPGRATDRALDACYTLLGAEVAAGTQASVAAG